eukprot:c11380_g1_i2.p2 GENE.c11380_g1_i2~~c11380_g1_i2.p2  ORF type:complete len:126 (-),score=28.10 c11380_g1_i2:352-684(-)
MSVPYDEELFEDVAPTGLDITRVEAGQIRKGEHIVIRGCPCRVVEVTVSKTGKHGHAKCAITALDIFTGNQSSKTKQETGADFDQERNSRLRRPPPTALTCPWSSARSSH